MARSEVFILANMMKGLALESWQKECMFVKNDNREGLLVRTRLIEGGNAETPVVLSKRVMLL